MLGVLRAVQRHGSGFEIEQAEREPHLTSVVAPARLCVKMLCSRAALSERMKKKGPRYGWSLLDWRSYFLQGRAPHVWSMRRVSIQSIAGAGVQLACLHGQHFRLSVRALVLLVCPNPWACFALVS